MSGFGNSGWGNQNPNQNWGNQNPNQGWGNQNPNQGWGNQIPNQGWGNQNQPFGNQGNQIWPNQKPNQNWGNNTWGTTNPFNWHNPFGMTIPQVSFLGGCRKCCGSGIINRNSKQMPCRGCYRRQGFCTKCYGTGVNYMKNYPCKKCHGSGQFVQNMYKKKKHSSSSSDSD